MPASYFSRVSGESTQRFFSVAKLPRPWPTMPAVIPHRLRRKFRSTKSRVRSMQTPTSSIASLQTSLRPADTLRALRTHQWSYNDAQYILLAVVGIFSLSVIESPGPFVKTLVATLLIASLTLPLTRQFFLPFLPIAAYLIFFYACRFISGDYRPPIWVRVLPALENILYGANLSNILSAHKSTFLDVLAWLPYGLTHFGAPAVCAALIFVFGPPGSTPVFARTFGYMNVTGVFIQLCFPCSPPWYENKYGLAPADYSMPGSPAGLAAIDRLLGIDLYTSNFTASPVVFGAFPSLHSACATLEALFMAHTFPRLRPLFILYALWIWWATMYLSHHYAVDLTAGSFIAAAFYFVAVRFLPRLQPGKTFRWEYDYVEYGSPDPTSSSSSSSAFHHDRHHAYDLAPLHESHHHHHRRGASGGGLPGDSDEWTIASGSSFSSSAGREPASAGMRSPVTDDSTWEGETLASGLSSSCSDGGMAGE